MRLLADLGAGFSPAMASVVPDGEADYSQENLAEEALDLLSSPTCAAVPALAQGRYVIVDTLDELYAKEVVTPS